MMFLLTRTQFLPSWHLARPFEPSSTLDIGVEGLFLLTLTHFHRFSGLAGAHLAFDWRWNAEMKACFRDSSLQPLRR